MPEINTPRLIYVVDPMCSWCWGFSPILEEIIQRYQVRIPLQIMMGGLRPGNTERFDEGRRSYILGHWQAVHQRTGQPFNFNFQMGSTFTYNTEPASRAVLVVRSLAPKQEAKYLHQVQEAFYVRNEDVTGETILADLAEKQSLSRTQFLEHFQDPAVEQSLWEEFDQARALGVNGFPTLLGREGEQVAVLTHGYQPLDGLILKIESWLSSTASQQITVS